jgi:hypothetical protein
MLAGTSSFALVVRKGEATLPSAIGWSRTYGGPYGEEARSLVQTGDGGYAVAGWTVNFTFGNVDVWLVKTDVDGIMEWNRTYVDEDSDEEARSVIQTSDGGYVVAGKTYSDGLHDAVVIRTDANGDAVGCGFFGGAGGDQAFSVLEADGGYVFAGHTDSFSLNSDFWLVKLDSGGDVVWNRTYGGDLSEEARSLVQTTDGGYALAGHAGLFEYNAWLVKTDASGIILWNKTYWPYTAGNRLVHSLVQTTDSGFALAGGRTVVGSGTDFWLLKTDVNGDAQWDQTYGGDSAFAVVQTVDGGYALSGYTSSYGAGGSDFWLVRTDASGVVLWNQTYGGTLNDYSWSMIGTTDEGYAMAGVTYSFEDRDGDFWVVKTDENGIVPELPSTGLVVTVVLVVAAAVLALKRRLPSRVARN